MKFIIAANILLATSTMVKAAPVNNTAAALSAAPIETAPASTKERGMGPMPNFCYTDPVRASKDPICWEDEYPNGYGEYPPNCWGC